MNNPYKLIYKSDRTVLFNIINIIKILFLLDQDLIEPDRAQVIMPGAPWSRKMDFCDINGAVWPFLILASVVQRTFSWMFMGHKYIPVRYLAISIDNRKHNQFATSTMQISDWNSLHHWQTRLFSLYFSSEKPDDPFESIITLMDI